MKVQVVDDDKDFLKMIAENIYGFGFEVAMSSSYDDALTAFESFQPNVVLIDYLMKGDSRTGIDLATELKSQNKNAILGLVTGLLVREPFDSDLFSVTFHKPFPTSDLCSWLKSLQPNQNSPIN